MKIDRLLMTKIGRGVHGLEDLTLRGDANETIFIRNVLEHAISVLALLHQLHLHQRQHQYQPIVVILLGNKLTIWTNKCKIWKAAFTKALE